jgi:hypothetical protein
VIGWAFVVHVLAERRDDPFRVYRQARERDLEIEQVPRLLALIERAELRASSSSSS